MGPSPSFPLGILLLVQRDAAGACAGLTPWNRAELGRSALVGFAYGSWGSSVDRVAPAVSGGRFPSSLPISMRFVSSCVTAAVTASGGTWTACPPCDVRGKAMCLAERMRHRRGLLGDALRRAEDLPLCSKGVAVCETILFSVPSPSRSSHVHWSFGP